MRQVAAELLSEIRRPGRRIAEATAALSAAVAASGTTLAGLHGIGDVIAAKILARSGAVSKFRPESAFASYRGVAPVEVSSGDVQPHRLSRAGDRQLNYALHVMAMAQIKRPTPGRDYYQRKRAAGKTCKEAMRCLKRRLADIVYRIMIHGTGTSQSPAPLTTEAPLQGQSPTLIAARVLWVFPLWACLQRRQGQRRPSWTVPAVISWAGTRGVVPLAAALSIPLAASDGTPLPQRNLLLVLAVTVIVISLVVQGMTLEPLVRRTALALPPSSTRREEATARLRMAEAGITRLDELAASQEAPGQLIDRIRRTLDTRAEYAHTQIDAGDHGFQLSGHDLHRDVLKAQGSELARLYADGTISAATRRRLQRTLDLELSHFRNDTDWTPRRKPTE